MRNYNRENAETDAMQHITDTEHANIIKISGIDYNISNLTSKIISGILIRRIQKPPTALDKWMDEFPFLNENDFKTFSKLPYSIIRETKLQSFQFKLINRIINCKDRLYKMNLSDSPLCTTCKETETIEHMLVTCVNAKMFWSQISNWIQNNLGFKIKLSMIDILFGIPFHNDNLLLQINFMIVHAKWYIHTKNNQEKPLFLLSFLIELKRCLEIEVYQESLYVIDHELRSKWNELYIAL